jgi:hypothetical protein
MLRNGLVELKETRMTIQRISMGDHLAAATGSENSDVARAAATIPALKMLSIALDQATGRSEAAVRDHGELLPVHRDANAGDLAEAERQAAVLAVASKVAQSMLDAARKALTPGTTATPAAAPGKPGARK